MVGTMVRVDRGHLCIVRGCAVTPDGYVHRVDVEAVFDDAELERQERIGVSVERVSTVGPHEALALLLQELRHLREDVRRLEPKL